MAMPRYPNGCAAGSQACGEAPPEFEGARVVVGFHNGNVNNNNGTNRLFALAVRAARESAECLRAVRGNLWPRFEREVAAYDVPAALATLRSRKS